MKLKKMILQVPSLHGPLEMWKFIDSVAFSKWEGKLG